MLKGFEFIDFEEKYLEQLRAMVDAILQEYGFTIDLSGVDIDLQNPGEFYKNGFFKLIIFDNTLIGCFGMLLNSEKQAEIRKLYIQSSFRNRGLGTQCMSYLMKKLIKSGVAEVFLETAEQMKEAIMLYNKLGFNASYSSNCPKRCQLKFYKRINELANGEV